MTTATDTRCFLCQRIDDGSQVLLSLADGSIAGCCAICWEKSDVEEQLDYMTDEGDDE